MYSNRPLRFRPPASYRLAALVLSALLVFGPVAASAQSAATPAAAGAEAKAPEKELVAVLDVEAAGATALQATAITDRLREAILATARFVMVDRSKMDSVLKEQALQQTGCTSQECAVQVGKVLGVRKIVAAKIVRVEEDLWLLSGILVDVETAETMRAASVQHEGPYRTLLASGIENLANKLAGLGEITPAAKVARSGSLRVRSEAPNTRIYVDGEFKGTSGFHQALDIANLAEGPHILRAEAQGYKEFTMTVTVKAGETAEQFTAQEIMAARASDLAGEQDAERKRKWDHYYAERGRWITGWVSAGIFTALLAGGAQAQADTANESFVKQQKLYDKARNATTLDDFEKYEKQYEDEKKAGEDAQNLSNALAVMSGIVGIVFVVKLFSKPSPPPGNPVSLEIRPASPLDPTPTLSLAWRF